MRVTFYGVRGSIADARPVDRALRRQHRLRRACARVDGTLVVLDAGTGIRVLGDELVAAGTTLPIPSTCFVTHAHWDHIIGAPFFAPIYRKDAHIILHAMSARAEASIAQGRALRRRALPRAHRRPARAPRARRAFVDGPCASARRRCARSQLNHPGGCEGFRIDDDDGSSRLLPDRQRARRPPGVVATPSTSSRASPHGVGLLIHDAQYMPDDMPAKRGWGHSRRRRCARARHATPRRARSRCTTTIRGATITRSICIANHARAWCRAHAPKMSTLVASEGLALEVKP